MSASRAALRRRVVARVSRRPRRGAFERERFAQLSHALRGKVAVVVGLRARVAGLLEMVGGVEVSVDVDLGEVTLQMDHEDVRGLLAEGDPAAKVFEMVGEVIVADAAGELGDEGLDL